VTEVAEKGKRETIYMKVSVKSDSSEGGTDKKRDEENSDGE